MGSPGNATVCHGIIEDLDITGIGESQQIVCNRNFDFSIDCRCPIHVLCDELPLRSAHEFPVAKHDYLMVFIQLSTPVFLVAMFEVGYFAGSFWDNFLSFRYIGPFWTLLFTNLALVVSAFIQALNETISLYNAIIVIYLCFLYSFSSLFVLNILRWVHRKNMDDTLKLFYASHNAILFGFVLLVATKNNFGSQPECNSVVHVTRLTIFCQWLIFDSSGCPLTF